MSSKKLSILFFLFSCSLHVIAQTGYYYYDGNKMPLTLNENKVCVSISKMNSLDCANRIYESGDFAESTPDFASINSLINTTVRNQTSETSEESSIYDMQGRKTQQELKKGIYIQNGRKYIVK